MSVLDNSVDVAAALGKGVYSVGQDIVLGIQRSGEGLGFGNDGRMAEIGHENSAILSLLEEFFRYGASDKKSPLYKSIVHILEHYYSFFPDDVISALTKQAGIGAGYTAGRMVIGKKLAEAIATKIAVAIAASTAYKQIAKRIGISAGASTTGIGTPIGLLMAQGLMQRSSLASARLRMKSPQLYFLLQRNGDLQLLYFLLEEPLKKYIQAIHTAEKNYTDFINAIDRQYKTAQSKEALGM